jgi:hypothetical protein
MKIALLRCSVCFGWLYLGSDSAASPYLRPHAFPPDGCTYHSLVQLCRRAIQCGFARCASDRRPRLGADGVELASVPTTGRVCRSPYLRARPALPRRGTHSPFSFFTFLTQDLANFILARVDESLRSAMGRSGPRRSIACGLQACVFFFLRPSAFRLDSRCFCAVARE